MGNSQSDSATANDCLSVLADVAFRTSNYSPLEGSVNYKVLLRRGPVSSIEDENKLVASAHPSARATPIAVAEQRRKFLDPGSEIDMLLAEGFNLVSTVPLGDNNFLIFLLRCEHTTSIVGLKESRLSVVNAELKLDRLRGETLVVGSQKLVLAGADPPDNSSDELLEAIAHETANGGRLIGAWPNGPVMNGLVKRLDVLFQIPTSNCDNQYYAYQLTFTSLSDKKEGSDEEEELNRHIGRLSDDMHKALEAGWGLVDTVMASNDVLIWFLEREVSDALVNEPSYEGRVIVFSFNDTEPERIAASLNSLGHVGWILRSIVTLSGSLKPKFIAFFQRQVERNEVVASAVADSGRANIRPGYGSRDMFAPPVYRPYDSYQLGRGNAYVPDDEECDLPHYEDIIDRR